VPGRSYGLAIARRLGLAGDVLDLAERAVPDAERALDALLATVEARARELEARERDLATRLERLDEDVHRGDTRGEEIATREGEGEAGAPRRPPSPARPPAGAGRPTPATTAATEVSLIGLRVADAEPVLAKALDDAVLADLPYLRVIHGKGTGALRQLVHDVLEGDKRVKRFGFAPANQGGHGVTVAEFTE